MLNRSSVDRGMFVHTCYKTLLCEENKKTNCSFERIEVPPPKSQNKSADYSKLGKNGIAMKGVPVYKGDIIIGKTLTKVQKDEEEKIDCSLAVGNGEEGIVDEIWEGVNEEGYKMVKVRIRQLRTPEVGDKFASRSSQKGVCGLLLSQEDMPFTQEGISPDLLINPHCFTAESQVSLYNGLSRPIGEMSETGGENVWTYDYDQNGLTHRKNLGMEWKGRRKVVKMTMQDGRTIRCTPDHKFYTTDKKWVEAKDLDMKKDKIIMGLDGVQDVNYGDEGGWKLATSNFMFSCDTHQNREKSMAFARILGHVLTDGCVYQISSSEFRCPVHFGHSIDAEICIQDIYLITGKTPKICKSSENGKASTYLVYVPYELSKSIGLLDGVTIGRKTRQDSDWPTFVKECPKSILREFLASMFGGDGHEPYIQGRNGSRPVCVKFSKSIHSDFNESFAVKIQNLCDLLNQFDVEAEIERIREFRNERDELFYSYYITIKNSLKFSQTIGFRYCTEKMSRLCLYKSYMEFQERVKAQSERILSLVDQYSVNMAVHRALSKAREELLKTEPSLNEYYSLSSMNQIGNRRKSSRSTEVLHLNYRYFPAFTKYLDDMGCLEWYSKTEYITKRDIDVLPTFHMRPIRIVEDGEEDVYCIGVDEFHNFICSGLTVSNCLPSRMTMSQLIEMLLGKTSALSGKLGDSTAFSKGSINPTESISKQLAELGFERHGNERLFSGYTGEMLQADIFIGTAYYQRLKHLVKDKMHCLTLDHQVLTLDGWRPIGELTTNDRVATLSQTTGVLEYQCPTKIWRYENYEGEMVHIKSPSIDLSVTSHHRMWIKGETDSAFRFEEASETVGKGYQYKKDAEWKRLDYLHPNTESLEETEELTLKPTDQWVFELSANQTRVLIDSITMNSNTFTGTSEETDRLQRLCLHAGWISDIDDNTIRIHRGVVYPIAEKTMETVTYEKCDVMCITVPNEVFYVRRNGKAVWTGNSRARGNVTMMHHQPSEGRSKDGGLRTGEMERDALIAHGGSAFIQETFFDMSDVYQVNVCGNCGSMLSAAKECRVCKKGDVSKTNIPYCAKLLLQELQALGVSIKISTSEKKEK